MEGEVEPMNEQFNNVAEMGPEGDATDVEIRDGTGKVASPSPRKPNPLLILARIALYGASVFLVFTVTLGCFPAITMLVQSTGVIILRVFCCPLPLIKQPQRAHFSNSHFYIITSVLGSRIIVVDRLLRARGLLRSLQRRGLGRTHPRRAPHLAESGQGKLSFRY